MKFRDEDSWLDKRRAKTRWIQKFRIRTSRYNVFNKIKKVIPVIAIVVVASVIMETFQEKVYVAKNEKEAQELINKILEEEKE